MKLYVAILSVTALLLVGCDNGPWDAPPNAVIGEVDPLKVAWFGCQLDPATGMPMNPSCDIEQPSPPVIFPLTIDVYDEDTEVPVNNVWVRFTTGYVDIYVLPQEVIEAVALPDSTNWTDIAETSEVWAEFSGSFEGDYRPTFAEVWTDNYGRATVWVWVQRMPVDVASGQAKESMIMIDIGADSQIVDLQAGS
jgi:hypothetical protein